MSHKNELPPITPFTFGTGQLGDTSRPELVKTARAAMEAKVWFHSCETYAEGRVFENLRRAFKEAPSQVPSFIMKVDGASAASLEKTVKSTIKGLGLKQLGIGQLCGNPPVDKLRPGGEVALKMEELVKQGLVGHFCLEIFQGFSENLIHAVREDLLGSVTFYLNVHDRETSPELFDLIQTKQVKVLALRTLGRQSLETLPDPAKRAKWKELADEAGCASLLEFQVRFPLSFPNVKTTIGATSSIDHLNLFLDLVSKARPLPAGVVEKAMKLGWKG